jgi:hypothetical protein
MEKSTHREKLHGKLGKWHILQKDTCTGEKSLRNWENGIFYGNVHPQDKGQWETGKMACFMERSTHRAKMNGNTSPRHSQISGPSG